jgi:hypothetical protein
MQLRSFTARHMSSHVAPMAFALFMGVTALGLSGCGGTVLLSQIQGVPPGSGWLEIRGNRFSDEGAGIVLELPDVPYRARYSDGQGVYYQAALPLIYRSAFGVQTAVVGGLYVSNGRADSARSWSEPILLSPRMAHGHFFGVQLHPPS